MLVPFCNTDVPASLSNSNDNRCHTDLSLSSGVCRWVHRNVLLPSFSLFSWLILVDDLQHIGGSLRK